MSCKKYALPPKMYGFERDGLFLFYEPVHSVWFRTDALGKVLIDVLTRGGDGREAAVEVAHLSGVPLEIATSYVEGSLRKLLAIGFLHESEPVRSHAPSPPGRAAAPFW